MLLIFGDSWTAKWQHWEPWPSVLKNKYNIENKNFAMAGASNQHIVDEVAKATILHKNENVEKVIVAFTSISRLSVSLNATVELCVANNYQPEWYKHIQQELFNGPSVNSLIDNTKLKLHTIQTLVKETWGCDTIIIPTFEDCEHWNRKSLLSILKYQETNRFFSYPAPVYEIGILQTVNKLGNEWCEKNLDTTYERAYFERTEYITESSKMFDDTTHPNQTGHDLIAKYLVEHNIISS